MTHNPLKPDDESGFSMLEVLFSLCILTGMFLVVNSALVYSYRANLRSEQNFRIQMVLLNLKGELMSAGFHAETVREGVHARQHKEYFLRWMIRRIESGLKEIEISVSLQQRVKTIKFYKSKYLWEVNND